MPIVKVTRNYQITIPEEIRKKKGIKEGDRVVAWMDDEGRIVIEKIEGSVVDESFGSWKGEEEGTKYVDRVRKGWKEREEMLKD
ncbi:MAG: AbrB/MazE/SpoVT family DNA-binding domain-containing protein [Candidatus Freyarchaeota archaeon]|nr:AbrB/MazE/SpoVT family DNA-binding domain-containing protein [Candidatus Jordarchaeia archaeon]MBS7269116.1 AbrB/MazE/SpoVT family DNA-binding domain-containing protein [Candidatus Jordarchaeia archaeon]MBS7279183.1 AbrB/MazE/SpoVT family DNA-binding domain-containing protein [Candidatus Jordarchaeia archaeon]